MIFQHTWQQVLDGTKTQTRRLVKPDDVSIMAKGQPREAVAYITYDGRLRRRWTVGKTYAVRPARNQAGVARIRITRIRREDVRKITIDDLEAEGFDFGNPAQHFFYLWCHMHDREALKIIAGPPYGWDGLRWWQIVERLQSRPDEYYDAWVLEFEFADRDGVQ